MLISIDHGNKQIKTIHCPPFISGLGESTKKPYGKDILKYQNLYYNLTGQRIPYLKNKTEDNRYFVLSLFAIANEIEARSCYSSDVIPIELAIGVPPAYYGSQGKDLKNYFLNRDVIKYEAHGRLYSIYFSDVACFPQAYAAAVTLLPTLVKYPKAVIVDIGGHTSEYLVMKYGKTNFNSLLDCDSLENGLDVLYNKIRSVLNAELDVLLEESDIDSILRGEHNNYRPEAVKIVERLAQEFINDLFSTLRERGLDLRNSKVIFVGGGAILLRRQIEASSKVANVQFVEDINANAKGYEFLYQAEVAGR